MFGTIQWFQASFWGSWNILPVGNWGRLYMKNTCHNGKTSFSLLSFHVKFSFSEAVQYYINTWFKQVSSDNSWKWKWSRSVVSDSLRPHRLYPTRLPCPWDFPGISTGVDCHFLLQGIFPTQGSNQRLRIAGRPFTVWATRERTLQKEVLPIDPGWLSGNESACNTGDVRHKGLIPGWKDSLEEGMATHSSILAWRILWTEEPGGLQFIGLQRIRHDWSDWACTHASVGPWCPCVCLDRCALMNKHQGRLPHKTRPSHRQPVPYWVNSR